jgi:hypothetical protein
MLTYLAVALPRYSSPAARLLALQCMLRADRHGRVRLPHGLLRGMRLRGRAELWNELEYAGWLRCPAPQRPHADMRLLDVALQDQTAGRSTRARAAHWALHPVPLAPPRVTSASVQLTALVLAAHTADGAGSAETDVLTRLCGQSSQQLEDVLDQLVRLGLLTAWRHTAEHGDVSWQLPRDRSLSSGT